MRVGNDNNAYTNGHNLQNVTICRIEQKSKLININIMFIIFIKFIYIYTYIYFKLKRTFLR